MNVKDKVIIVTGASKGIGLATSKLLASKGAKVVLSARSENIIKDLEKELTGSFAVKADMTIDADVKNLIKEARNKFGRIDILINNAGQGMWIEIEKGDIEMYKKLVDLNVYGYLRSMQAVIPVMREQGGGIILNVSSMVTRDYIPGLALYASTKYAVNALTLTAARELAKDKIIVKLIRPKLVDTKFGEHALVEEPSFLRDWNNPNHPPMDKPQQVAEKILELLSNNDTELDM